MIKRNFRELQISYLKLLHESVFINLLIKDTIIKFIESNSTCIYWGFIRTSKNYYSSLFNFLIPKNKITTANPTDNKRIGARIAIFTKSGGRSGGRKIKKLIKTIMKGTICRTNNINILMDICLPFSSYEGMYACRPIASARATRQWIR